jgi:hypothetical protein
VTTALPFLVRRSLLAGSLAAGLLGCDPRSDCPILVNAAAPQLARIEEQRSPDTHEPTPAELRALSLAYTELAAALDHAELYDNRIKSIAARYQESSKELAAGLEILAKAREHEEPGLLSNAKDKLALAGAKERRVLQDLRSMCTRP